MKAPRHPARFEPGGEWQAELQELAQRREQSLALTARRRPDLIAAARAAGRLSRDDERYLKTL